MSNDVFILSAVRTDIGTFGGSLKDHSPTKLGAIVVKEAIRRANLEPDTWITPSSGMSFQPKLPTCFSVGPLPLKAAWRRPRWG